MANSGDKFASLLIPNCQRSASQEEKLHSSVFAREGESPDEIRLSSSSTDESSEQVTGIELVSLPDSSDEYQTPPEQPCYSQNSSNDGHVAATKMADFDHGETQGQRIVDLDTDPMDVDDQFNEVEAPDSVSEVVETEVISSPEEQQSAHQVFVEMPVRKQEVSKRGQLAVSVKKTTQKQNINDSKHEGFANILNRVLKMAQEAKSSRGGNDGGGGGGGDEDGEVEVDFLETAKMRGLTFPRPRWWPAEGFKD